MDCYVLACGPSIKDQDLKKIKNSPCITISNFFVHEEFENLNVECHIFAKLHNPITPQMGIAWFKEAELKFKKNQKVMVHYSDKDLVEENKIFKNQNVIYWKDGSDFGNNFPYEVGPYLSASQLALQYAIYLNTKNIYLLGIDHSWSNHVNQSKHFYEENQSVLTRMGYNEWFNSYDNETAKQIELDNLDRLSSIYLYYDNICKEKQINLFNSTPGSMITCLKQKIIKMENFYENKNNCRNRNKP